MMSKNTPVARAMSRRPQRGRAASGAAGVSPPAGGGNASAIGAGVAGGWAGGSPSGKGDAKGARHGVHILVAAPAEVHEDRAVGRQGGRQARGMGDGVGRFQGGDDALTPAEELECFQRLGVGGRGVLGAANVLEVAVLRPDARVVEAGADAMGGDDLAVRILQEIGARTVEHADLAGAERSGVGAGLDAVPGRFNADQAYLGVVQERVEYADGVAAAAHTGDHVVRQTAELFEALGARLAPDDRLEVAYQARVGVGADRAADQVV